MLRLFTGLELADFVREEIARIQGGIPNARWITSENLHITLCFIGEVEEPVATAIDEALARIRQNAFSMSCAGTGVFGSPLPRSLWSGISKSPELAALQKANVTALRGAGLYLERRRYRPHVTLARLRGKRHREVGRWLSDNGLFRSETFAVENFVLFSSHLGGGKAVYRVEKRYPLEI